MGGTSDALAPRHDSALQGHLMLPITQKWTHLEKVSEDIIKLAGGNPDQSRWLVENLAGLTDALRWKKQIEDERPKKAELRKKLNNLHSAARLVEDSLKRRPRRNLNPDYTASVLELIHLVRPHLTPQLGSLAYLIHQYALAVEEAMTTISRKPGATRVKPPPSNLLDSMGWCALIICEVWRTCRAGYPGENNPKAQQAADLLWDAVL